METSLISHFAFTDGTTAGNISDEDNLYVILMKVYINSLFSSGIVIYPPRAQSTFSAEEMVEAEEILTYHHCLADKIR